MVASRKIIFPTRSSAEPGSSQPGFSSVVPSSIMFHRHHLICKLGSSVNLHDLMWPCLSELSFQPERLV